MVDKLVVQVYFLKEVRENKSDLVQEDKLKLAYSKSIQKFGILSVPSYGSLRVLFFDVKKGRKPAPVVHPDDTDDDSDISIMSVDSHNDPAVAVAPMMVRVAPVIANQNMMIIRRRSLSAAPNPNRVNLVFVVSEDMRRRLRQLDLVHFYSSVFTTKPFAFLVINSEFRTMAPRPGSQIDGELFGKCVHVSDYQCILLKNLKGFEMLNLARAVSTMPANRTRDRTLFFYSSHGCEGVLFGSDDMPVHIEELKVIVGRSEFLKGKPKVWVFSACRTIDQAIPQYNPGCETSAGHHEDNLCIYSTSYGHVSIREEVNYGCIFVSYLCEEIARNGYRIDLMAIVRKLSQFFKNNMINYNGNMVTLCPDMSTSTSRLLYFPVTRRV